MRILALDTGGARAGVTAIESTSRGLEVKSVQVLPESRQLARNIMQLVDVALSEAGWRPASITVVAVGLGPGSWTGLRIGLAMAKTLAQALDCQLAGVPTFDAMAQAAWRELLENDALAEAPTLLLATMPCRAGELYGQLYQCDSEYIARVQDAWIAPATAMADTLAVEAMSRGIDAPPILAGPATAMVGSVLQQREESYATAKVEVTDLCVEIAASARAMVEEGEASDPLLLQPLYLAPSAAERNLAARGR